MTKWDYITIISKKSNKTGDKLLELMEFNRASNLQEITEQQAKSYYLEKIINTREERRAWTT